MLHAFAAGRHDPFAGPTQSPAFSAFLYNSTTHWVFKELPRLRMSYLGLFTLYLYVPRTCSRSVAVPTFGLIFVL